MLQTGSPVHVHGVGAVVSPKASSSSSSSVGCYLEVRALAVLGNGTWRVDESRTGEAVEGAIVRGGVEGELRRGGSVCVRPHRWMNRGICDCLCV